jgi:gluconolactonase
VQTELAFPNGIGISPIDGRLYVCESAKNRILSFKINENGKLGNKKVFVELPGGDPDGFNFDVEGNLYVAHFGGGNLFVISPDGTILKTVKTPGLKPTNVEFAGDDKKTLYLTEVETNSIYRCRVSIAGHSFF